MWAWISVHPWQVLAIAYAAVALLAFVPVLKAIMTPVRLAPGGDSFEQSIHFSPRAKERLAQHYTRLQGTLGFWKKQAARHGRFHIYSICWTIPAATVIPLLAQAAGAAQAPLTVISLHTALILGFHRGFKVESNYRAFRQGESEFYDLYRRLLDQPLLFGKNEDEQLTKYFQEVEVLRRFVRNAETDNIPMLEDTKPGRTQTVSVTAMETSPQGTSKVEAVAETRTGP